MSHAMKPFSLSRRTVLKGAGGVAIALPWLEAMTREKPARANLPGTTPRRFLAVYWPGGTVRAGSLGDRYTPTGTETEFTLSPILAPLEPVKSSVLIADGLWLMAGDQSKFSVEQLQGGMMAWLTGQVQPGSGNFQTKGPSIDQVLAPRLSMGKPFPSLAVAVRWGTGKAHGKLTPMDVCQFDGTAPYRPIPPRIDPVDTWKTLFGDPGPAKDARAWESSILDAVDKRYAKLAQRLGAADRQRLEAHLERIRDLEKRVGSAAVGGACKAPTLVDTSDYNPASGLNSANDGSIKDLATDAAIPKVGKLFMDMIVMAFACDLTSVALMQWVDSEAKYTLPWLGLSEVHSFYENDGGFRPAECEKIYTWYFSQHAYLLQQLASIDVGGHSLLDETLVFFGSEEADPASHSKRNMPFVLAGGGLRTGRWVKFSDGTPHNNLLVSLLNVFGDPRTTFGDDRCCTGPLSGLV
jgi:hypothetical protein